MGFIAPGTLCNGQGKHHLENVSVSSVRDSCLLVSTARLGPWSDKLNQEGLSEVKVMITRKGLR